jgi:DNA-binding MarR family transcriptional regulator
MKTIEALDTIDRGIREMFQLHKNLISGFRPKIGPSGLNHTHWRAMMHISESGSDCMKGIGRHVGLEAGSFTPVADRLIDEGLVERIPDPEDRRRILLRLTASGKSAVEEMKRLLKKHYARKLSFLDEKQLGHLVSAMAAIGEINSILQGRSNE